MESAAINYCFCVAFLIFPMPANVAPAASRLKIELLFIDGRRGPNTSAREAEGEAAKTFEEHLRIVSVAHVLTRFGEFRIHGIIEAFRRMR